MYNNFPLNINSDFPLDINGNFPLDINSDFPLTFDNNLIEKSYYKYIDDCKIFLPYDPLNIKEDNNG